LSNFKIIISLNNSRFFNTYEPMAFDFRCLFLFLFVDIVLQAVDDFRRQPTWENFHGIIFKFITASAPLQINIAQEIRNEIQELVLGVLLFLLSPMLLFVCLFVLLCVSSCLSMPDA